MEPHLVQLIKAVSTGKGACNVLILILKEIVLDLPQAILLICIHRQVEKKSINRLSHFTYSKFGCVSWKIFNLQRNTSLVVIQLKIILVSRWVANVMWIWWIQFMKIFWISIRYFQHLTVSTSRKIVQSKIKINQRTNAVERIQIGIDLKNALSLKSVVFWYVETEKIIIKISFYKVWNQYITWLLQWPSLWHRCSIMLFWWCFTTDRNVWCEWMSMCPWNMHRWPFQLLRLRRRMDRSAMRSAKLQYHVSKRRSSCLRWVRQMPLFLSNQYGRRLLPSEPMFCIKLYTWFHSNGSNRCLFLWMWTWILRSVLRGRGLSIKLLHIAWSMCINLSWSNMPMFSRMVWKILWNFHTVYEFTMSKRRPVRWYYGRCTLYLSDRILWWTVPVFRL